MKLRLLAVGALAALAVPLSALAGPATMHPELGAKLVGSQEVPKGSKTAHGIVNVTLNSGKKTVCWTFHTVGLSGASAAHIHKGKPGVAGPVVVPFGKTYRKKGCATASKSLIEAIEAHPNAYYVNVHTAKFPAGAIRGQLVAGMVHM